MLRGSYDTIVNERPTDWLMQLQTKALVQEEKPTRTTHHIVTSTLKHAGRTIRDNELIIRRAWNLDVSVWVRSQLPARPLQVLDELFPLGVRCTQPVLERVSIDDVAVLTTDFLDSYN